MLAMRRPSAVKASQAPSGCWTGRNQAGTSTSHADGQPHGVPVLGPVVEGTADVHDVDAQALEQLVRGLGELLDDVVDPRALVAHGQVLHEAGVRDGRDAGAGRGAQVHRQPVRLAVLDRGQDPAPGGQAGCPGHAATPRAGAGGSARTRGRA